MIVSGLICLAVGIVIMIFGIMHTTGNISTLHSYHRNNIKEEDKKPFGKRVGVGTIIMGASCVALGLGMLLGELLSMPILVTIGYVSMTVGFIIGIIIALWAIKKYNKTIF